MEFVSALRSRPLPEKIEAQRLTLRKHTLEVAGAIFDAVERDRQRLREFLPWVDFTRTLREEEDYIRMTIERWESSELFDFGMYRKSDGAYLGNVGVHTVSWSNRRCELGYWIAREFEGQGYVTEAVGALEAALFAEGFHRIEIRCSSSNVRSAAVPRRAGYTLEAVLKDEAIENGRYRDTLIFAKLGK